MVRVWDVQNGKLRASLRGHTKYVSVLIFSHDGKMLATASSDQTVKLWDVATWQERMTLSARAECMAITTDGNKLATGSADGTVQLWRAANDKEALAFKTELDPDEPDSPLALNNLGDRVRTINLSHEAEAAYRQALSRLEKLVAEFPGEPDYLVEQARSCFSLGLLLATNNRPEEAEKVYSQATQLLEKLTAEFPRDSHYRKVLAVQLVRLAFSFKGAGRPQEAGNAYEKALTLAPRDAAINNNLAWLLATQPDPKFRDLGRALELAKEAVGLAAGEGMYWNTLGAAHYRAGDWKAAIEALTKSMGLRKGGDGNDWFFLAMAHWQLGDKSQARSWYDKAVLWMEKNLPKDEELLRFRAEAAALLGVKEK
jgi:tetratricopeptide (TPR) repeat protein